MSTVGYIDEHGIYHRGEERAITHDVNSMHREYSHSIERKEYAKEIIQPYTMSGKPNPDFMNAYPEYSRKYFSQETIDETVRKLS